MQTNHSKTRKQKEINSILESLDSFSISPSSNHGTTQSSSVSQQTRHSGSPASGTWSLQLSIHRETPSFIKKTPPEILVHIFSFLDSESFASASLVCREWHSVASDDYAWKAAFDRFFGIHSVVPRLSASWRGEYLHRSHLLRKWQLVPDPVSFYASGLRLHPITHMSALPPLQKRSQSLSRATGQIFLHGSCSGGFVTSSDPATGQVSRETLSHPDASRTATQSIAIHENIIAFGTSEGRVSIVDVNNRRKLDGGWKPMRGWHDFTVTALLIPSSPFRVGPPGGVGDGVVSLISASGSGVILLHDVISGETLGNYSLPGTPILPMCMVTYLAYDSESNVILAGTCTGDIWTLDTTKDTNLKQIAGTEYNQSQWNIPQTVLVNPQTEMLSLKVDVFFLSDLRNDSIFVIKENSIKRFGISNPSLTEFIGPDDATFTCATIDPDNYERIKPRIFAVGDNKGNVFVYNARAQLLSEDNAKVQLLYTISSVADIKVTALAMNPLVIVTGSNDGTAKAYSTLNGTLLRTLCSPNSRRRRLRPPSPADNSTQNPIVSISLTTSLKSEVRGVIAFSHGHLGYWNYGRDGVGIVLQSRKRRRIRAAAKDIKDFVNNEIQRDVEEGIEDANKRKHWEKLNGGIKEEDVAIQVALMMSREEEEQRLKFQEESAVEQNEDILPVVDEEVWEPGRKISFGCTSGSASPSLRGNGEKQLGDVVVFREEVSKSKESRRFDDDLEFAIRLSLAEYESRETNVPSE